MIIITVIFTIVYLFFIVSFTNLIIGEKEAEKLFVDADKDIS